MNPLIYCTVVAQCDDQTVMVGGMMFFALLACSAIFVAGCWIVDTFKKLFKKRK